MTNSLIATYIVMSLLLSIIFGYKYYKTKRTGSLISTIIVGWSGFIYINHFLEVVPLRQMYLYDWIISTPLLVLSLTLLNNNERITSTGLIASALQGLVILTGFLATGFDIWFFTGTVLMLGVFKLLWSMKRKGNELFYLLLFGTWSLYPFVWWYAGNNLESVTVALVILPFISKHVFTTLKELKT